MKKSRLKVKTETGFQELKGTYLLHVLISSPKSMCIFLAGYGAHHSCPVAVITRTQNAVKITIVVSLRSQDGDIALMGQSFSISQLLQS